MGRWRWIVALAVVLGSAGMAGVAHAAVVSCGQVITQSTVLEADVGPCPGVGLVIGAADITLDLGGHSIIGAPTSTSPGILLEAPILRTTNVRVRIANGTVTGFQIGVSVIRSVENTIERLVVRGNRCDGFFLQGIGSVPVGASDNVLRENVIQGNGCSGVHLFQRADRNVIERNLIAGNAADGVFLESTGPNNSARLNVVRQNSIAANGRDGIANTGLFNRFAGNAIRGNGANGVRIGGGPTSLGSRAEGNVVQANVANGVLIEQSGLENQVVGNIATGNGTVDLVDANFLCDNNVWAGNTFGTRSQPCIG